MLDVEGIMLTERFRQLLEQERQAEMLSAEMVGQVSDPAARQQLEEMHRDKLRHVQLVERLLEILE